MERRRQRKKETERQAWVLILKIRISSLVQNHTPYITHEILLNLSKMRYFLIYSLLSFSAGENRKRNRF